MDRVALVTGGSGALGQAIVHRFLRDGDTVCVPYIVDAERARLESSLDAATPARGLLEHCGVTVSAVARRTMDTPASRAAMPNVDPKTWVPVTAVADAVASLAAESAGHVSGTLLQI